MIFRFTVIVICALGIVGLTDEISYSAIHTYNFSLDGLQETPPNASPGTGLATVNYDDAIFDLAWTISYSDLLAGTTAAHFHAAFPGSPGPVVVGIPGATGTTSGTYTGNATITASQGTDLMAGLWYVNIHTTMFPGGEIRGQVVEDVPEPSTWALLSMAGTIGLFLLRKKL